MNPTTDLFRNEPAMDASGFTRGADQKEAQIRKQKKENRKQKTENRFSFLVRATVSSQKAEKGKPKSEKKKQAFCFFSTKVFCMVFPGVNQVLPSLAGEVHKEVMKTLQPL